MKQENGYITRGKKIGDRSARLSTRQRRSINPAKAQPPERSALTRILNLVNHKRMSKYVQHFISADIGISYCVGERTTVSRLSSVIFRHERKRKLCARHFYAVGECRASRNETEVHVRRGKERNNINQLFCFLSNETITVL